MSQRLHLLRRLLDEHDAEAVLLTHPPDIRWATGFTGSNALLAIASGEAHFLTDGRYEAQAADEVKDAVVHVPGYDLIGYLAEERLLPEGGRILVAAEHTTVARLAEIEEKLSGNEILPRSNLVTPLRAVKDEDEVDAIRAAQRLTERVFDHILPMIAVGVPERDLAAEIVYQHLRAGASGMAFEPIVASGRRSALPHARASSKPIAQGEVVLIDMGCYLGGYASDMTRTVAVGAVEPGVRAVYDAVLEAQLAAIDALHGGVSGRSVDAVARDVLAGYGFGAFFAHSLGHGVGLEVHEAPRLSHLSDGEVPAGAVVTVEPGVYLPERFGIRIEDIVVVRDGGAEVLTTTPKSLLVL